jgi:beta-glucosidase
MRQAAQIAFHAGVDMEMCSTCYNEHLESLIDEGTIPEERLDDAVRRILIAKFMLGLFEYPYTDPSRAEMVQFAAAHQALARQAARQSLVLLQNNGLLPLTKTIKKLAVIGPLAKQRYSLLGSWVLDGLAEQTQTLFEAIQQAVPGTEINDISDALTDEMLMHAAYADAVILAVGESNARNGEYNCVASLDLPAGQEALIEAVHGMGKPVVLVVLSGRPTTTLTRAARFADAILWCWHPGSLGAAGIADVLFGDASPGGRLPISFPRHTGQVPIHYNHNSTGKSFTRYLDMPATPLYPFGYGLTYTTFAYADIRIDRPSIRAGECVVVSALITNTGSRPGEEVAQCYVQDCTATITRPVRELKGFARIALQPGEAKRVSFTLDADVLSFYDRMSRWVLEPGSFKVWIGGSSAADLETGFRVKG